MPIPLYQVDAFTREPFKGNPAAVCLLDDAPDTALMQAIAAEMNLSETAFVQPLEEKPLRDCCTFSLRWFTPSVEVPLCGHATLATSAVLFDAVEIITDTITFRTLSGDLIARRVPAGGITLDFPVDPPRACTPPAEILAAMKLDAVQDAVRGERSTMLLLRLDSASQVRDLHPDFAALRAMEAMEAYHGLIVTAAGDAPHDFTSRFFAPGVGIDEDPVTGSAHTLLTPYWTEKLGKPALRAYQASARGGELEVRLAGDRRVELTGRAVLVFQGNLEEQCLSHHA